MNFFIITLIFLIKFVTSEPTSTSPLTQVKLSTEIVSTTSKKLVNNLTTPNPEQMTTKNQELPKIDCLKASECTLSHFNFTSKETIALLNIDDLKQFSKAKMINIEHSKMPEIPLELAKVFTEAENLNFSGIGLTAINRQVLKNFPKLKILDLSKNELKIINGDLFDENPELEVINLSENSIEAVKTKSIRNLKKLKALNLKDNKCINENFEKIGDERDKQKNMNSIMIKCRGGEAEKKNGNEGSIMEIIPKVQMTINKFANPYLF